MKPKPNVQGFVPKISFLRFVGLEKSSRDLRKSDTKSLLAFRNLMWC